jgi:hypothetical protein
VPVKFAVRCLFLFENIFLGKKTVVAGFVLAFFVCLLLWATLMISLVHGRSFHQEWMFLLLISRAAEVILFDFVKEIAFQLIKRVLIRPETS